MCLCVSAGLESAEGVCVSAGVESAEGVFVLSTYAGFLGGPAGKSGSEAGMDSEA